MLVSQSCPTFCNPMDCSPPGSSVHGISQGRIEEWAGKNRGVGSHSLLQGDRPSPGIKPMSPALQVDSLLSELPGRRWHVDQVKPYYLCFTSTHLLEKEKGE